jgi:hypothetical protein
VTLLQLFKLSLEFLKHVFCFFHGIRTLILGFCQWYKALKSDSECSFSNTNLLNKTSTNGIMEILKAYTLKGNPSIGFGSLKCEVSSNYKNI